MVPLLRYKSPSTPGIEALSCCGDFVFERHIHNGHVLWLNSEGGERFELPGSSAILQPGAISIIEPGVVHSNSPCPNSKRHLRSLYMDREFFSYLETLITGDSSGNFNLPTIVLDNPEYWRQAILLHEAILNGSDQLLLDELILSFFSLIGKIGFRERIEREAAHGSAGRISTVLDFMRENIDSDVSLSDLATLQNCTSFHLIRMFKKKMGISPHAYLVQLRLERARGLIAGGAGIAEAALEAGFSDQSHLTRGFKKRYGLTPGVYLSQKHS